MISKLGQHIRTLFKEKLEHSSAHFGEGGERPTGPKNVSAVLQAYFLETSNEGVIRADEVFQLMPEANPTVQWSRVSGKMFSFDPREVLVVWRRLSPGITISFLKK